MSHETCQYKNKPQHNFWKNVISDYFYLFSDKNSNIPPIKPSTVIATAGSCFAQNISKYLVANNLTFMLTEKAPNFLPKALHKEFGYGIYTARYGNIYSPRQLLQLILRAFGKFKPIETHWIQETSYLDPFRPFIQKGGYLTTEELIEDQNLHLKAVRQMFKKCELFIFTLGMTEIWINKTDGAVYPTSPGCGAGTFSSTKYEFHNLEIHELTSDLSTFIEELKTINPKCKIIFTVSPVPLIATFTNNNILVANNYSKSALRVAAEEMITKYDHVGYFPSYEIVTDCFTNRELYNKDCRTVHQNTISRVMEVFFKMYTSKEVIVTSTSPAEKAKVSVNRNIADILCEEELSVGNL